jgi:hypothetical protein
MLRAICLVVLLAGCVSQPRYPEIDYGTPPPIGWPQLREEFFYGSVDEVSSWCAKNPSNAGKRLAGCALIYLDAGVCQVYLSTRDDADLIAHERSHCRGFAHVGEAGLYKAEFERWKSKH